jgi:IS1 family transposase
MLVEGNSIRGIERMTNVSKVAILKLVADLGDACASYHDRHVRNLNPGRLELDEIWSFVGCKQKNLDSAKLAKGWGDAWTWVAIDPDTKLVVSYLVSKRDEPSAKQFLADCANRISGRVQLTTDGLRLYPEAIEKAFGSEVDYAMLRKFDVSQAIAQQGTSTVRKKVSVRQTISGSPDLSCSTTAHVERQNLDMRMAMRRFIRKTNGFSKTIEQHRNAVALHFMQHNFCRLHGSLRVTPAMEAGLSNHLWSMDEIIGLLPKVAIGPSLKDQQILLSALGRLELSELKPKLPAIP